MRSAAIRRRLPLVTVALAAAIAAPLGVLASHQFSDVPNTNIYHADIAALAGSGVTTGCGGGKYCPSDYVTREQMAAFMNRLGALGNGTTPVVNADEVDGADEVLAADEVVLSIAPEWLPTAGSAVSFTYFGGGTRITSALAGSRTIHTSLPSPEVIGGRAYGVESLEVCWLASPGITLTNATLIRLHGDDAIVVLGDPTDRALTTAGCVTMPAGAVDESGGPASLVIDLTYGAPLAYVELSDVRVTWGPVPAA